MVKLKLFVFILLFSFISCASGAKRLDSESDMVSDSGGLTRKEMEEAAFLIARKINVYFQKKPSSNGVFVALISRGSKLRQMVSMCLPLKMAKFLKRMSFESK